METKWFGLSQANDPIRMTNVPYDCFDRSVSGNWVLAYFPYCVGSRGWSGSAHYRERVAPEHGSGMYFNAYSNLAFSAPQQKHYLGNGRYAVSRGSFYVASNTTIIIFILSGAHLFHTSVGIQKWSGSSVTVNTNGWTTYCDYYCADDYHDDFGAVFHKKMDRVVLSGYPTMPVDQVGAWVFSQWAAVGGLSSEWVPGEIFNKTSYAPVPTPDELNSPKYFNWKDNEYWAFQWIREVGIVLPPYGSMISQAYTAAIATFPSVQSNTLANILELIELARSILSGDLGRTLKETRNVKAMKDAWLAYRYSYTTSKLDLAELKTFVDRVGALPVGEITLRSKITFHHTTVRCSVVLPMSDITGRLEGIESLGLKLSAANVWDLIPYSFVVDWFLRISDWLNYFETQGFALTLHPRQVWYSITTVYEGQTTYFRWSGSPALGLPFDLYAPVSNKTVAMRIGDVIALS